jgi:hydroxymethylpyrimidine kinase/phosphomethylpyrimidine kinase
VQAVHVPPPEFVAAQLRSVLSDIPISVIKTGMLPDAATVRVVCDAIRSHSSAIAHVVVDPVLVSTSGATLAGGRDCLDAIKCELLPLATVLTPNTPEAARILGWEAGSIRTVEDMQRACEALHALGAKAVVVKGGHVDGASSAMDVFYDGSDFDAFTLPWIDSKSTHGTGCTMASSIAAELAKGSSLTGAVRSAKAYVHRAIETAFDIGEGHGPLHHMHAFDETRY